MVLLLTTVILCWLCTCLALTFYSCNSVFMHLFSKSGANKSTNGYSCYSKSQRRSAAFAVSAVKALFQHCQSLAPSSRLWKAVPLLVSTDTVCCLKLSGGSWQTLTVSDIFRPCGRAVAIVTGYFHQHTWTKSSTSACHYPSIFRLKIHASKLKRQNYHHNP